MIAQLVAAGEPGVEQSEIGVAVDVLPGHQADRRYPVGGERRQQAASDPRAFGGVGMEIAAAHRQIVDGDQERPRGTGSGGLAGGGDEEQ